ncbi:MAG: hypothetical protein WCP55_04065 [Lentisphaerota bacterium]
MSKMTDKSSPRLFAILAREASMGVVFRRGPSKQVQLINWDTSKDKFSYGQWLKGRIYERRCDLSPSGEKLIYLAARWKKPIESWTAISKPPYLTALALWPNLGAWGGGGLFEHENTVCLNHRFDMGLGKLAEGFNVPKNIIVKPLGELSGHGEDDPIYEEHLSRDGWKLIEKAEKIIEHPRDASSTYVSDLCPSPGWHKAEYDPSCKIWLTYDPPTSYQKKMKNFILVMYIKGYGERNGPTYVVEYALKNENHQDVLNLGRLDWADWDKNGDLLSAKDGKLFRSKYAGHALKGTIEVADFNDSKFEEKSAPKK